MKKKQIKQALINASQLLNSSSPINLLEMHELATAVVEGNAYDDYTLAIANKALVAMKPSATVRPDATSVVVELVQTVQALAAELETTKQQLKAETQDKWMLETDILFKAVELEYLLQNDRKEDAQEMANEILSYLGTEKKDR